MAWVRVDSTRSGSRSDELRWWLLKSLDSSSRYRSLSSQILIVTPAESTPAQSRRTHSQKTMKTDETKLPRPWRVARAVDVVRRVDFEPESTIVERLLIGFVRQCR